MIVVDSSVGIGQFRASDRRAVSLLNRLVHEAGTIIVGDIVLVEVLRGARDDAHAEWIERRLRKFTVERMLDDRIAVIRESDPIPREACPPRVRWLR